MTFYVCVRVCLCLYEHTHNWVLFLYSQLKNIFFSCHDINVNTLIFALLSFTIAAVETSIHLLWYIIYSLYRTNIRNWKKYNWKDDSNCCFTTCWYLFGIQFAISIHLYKNCIHTCLCHSLHNGITPKMKTTSILLFFY